MVQKTGSLDYDGETFSFVLMEYHYKPMRTDMDMQNQIIEIEIALARARRESKKTDREKLVLDPEDQACDKAKTQEYTARKDPVVESRGGERPKKAYRAARTPSRCPTPWSWTRCGDGFAVTTP